MTVIRALLPGEARRYRDHLLRLPAEDRRARFMALTGDGCIAAHVDGIDWSRALILVAIDRGEVRAAGELRWQEDRAAEMALSVEPGYQGLGLGSKLLRRLVLGARNRCLSQIAMTCQSDNRRMQALARRHLGSLKISGGEVQALRVLSPPSPYSLALELSELVRTPLRTLVEGIVWPPLAPTDVAHTPLLLEAPQKT